jgi:phosphoesterase RecJ-like protein
MVNFGLAIRDAVATAFCVELEECVKVSFRSVEDIDVSAAARSFGGGGHRNAAGARLYGMSLGEAEARVAESLCRAVGAPAADHTN